MKKELKIELLELTDGYGIYESTIISKDEFPNIYLNREITEEEKTHAINVILTYMMQLKSTLIEVDLDKRNEDLDPINKLSLEELRKEYMKLKKRVASLDCKGGPFFDSTKK